MTTERSYKIDLDLSQSAVKKTEEEWINQIARFFCWNPRLIPVPEEKKWQLDGSNDIWLRVVGQNKFSINWRYTLDQQLIDDLRDVFMALIQLGPHQVKGQIKFRVNPNFMPKGEKDYANRIARLISWEGIAEHINQGDYWQLNYPNGTWLLSRIDSANFLLFFSFASYQTDPDFAQKLRHVIIHLLDVEHCNKEDEKNENAPAP